MKTNPDAPLFKRGFMAEIAVLSLAAMGAAAYEGTDLEKKRYGLNVAVMGTMINFVSMMMVQQIRIDMRTASAVRKASPLGAAKYFY